MDALNANRKTKQARKPNYTHEEITVLPKEVATNKVIIQSTLNSEMTNQQKSQLWQDIARKGSNCSVCVRTPDQVCEKLNDMKKDFFFREEKQQQQQKTTTTKQQTKKTKKETNKKWGTGAVRDKPSDKLLMFIVGRFSAVLRPVKTGGSVPFRFKCSSSSFSSFVIWRISAHQNLNCQNSSKSLNLCKGFVLSRKI